MIRRGRCSSSETTTSSHSSRVAARGDVVTLANLSLVPEHGFVPEPLFDSCGDGVSLVLQWGNYLPGLHQLVQGCRVGDSVEGISIDAGWGERRDDLLFRVPVRQLEAALLAVNKDPTPPSLLTVVGTTLKLKGGIEVAVAEMNDDGTVTLDANPPLAGTGYACSFTVLAIDPLPACLLVGPKDDRSLRRQCSRGDTDHDDRYQAATFALGCFWGAELAFMRVPGVAGTRVGYSQGVTPHPTYEQVCSGRTQHREAVQVIFDSTVVSYETLVQVALTRLQSVQSPLGLHRLFAQEGGDAADDDDTKQYRHGFYYHSETQREIAERHIIVAGENRFGIELLQAATFWDAEEWHQQYLYKGGQSARKGAKETIRCYG